MANGFFLESSLNMPEILLQDEIFPMDSEEKEVLIDIVAQGEIL